MVRQNTGTILWVEKNNKSPIFIINLKARKSNFMTSIITLINREKELFLEDLNAYEKELSEIVASSSFLVIGGAGSIGQAITKEIFKRNPRKLHVIDISENNMVELVRDIRSSYGYISGDFKTFNLDIDSIEYDALISCNKQYDYLLNLSALKHVRSEKDPYTLMRMINVNILNVEKTLLQAIRYKSKKYFCVSTDKAANPVNMMGGSKRIMEMFLMKHSSNVNVSTSRFANVAFSDGSLLYSFDKRIQKRQPIFAPRDVKRYFLTSKESGELCLLSCIFGENRDIFFPRLTESLHLTTFSEIAVKYLTDLGYEPYVCESEDEARRLINTLPDKGKWPCLFVDSDTTGEKDFEEFYTNKETVDFKKFKDIGIIKNNPIFNDELLELFRKRILGFKKIGFWSQDDLIQLFHEIIPNFNHKSTGKFLDQKM